MNDPVVYKNGRDWDDDRVERALSASANRTPRLSDTRRNHVLEALLDENARLSAQLSPAESSQISLWSDDQIAQFLAASAKATPSLSEDRKKNVLQVLLAESARLATESTPVESVQASLWDEARIDHALVASAGAAPAINGERKAIMLQALVAENARLAAQEKAAAPPKPSIWDRLNHLFNPRVLVAMTSTLAAFIFAFAYFVLGGTRPPVVAQAYGTFSMSEARQGLFGLQWQIPRSYAGVDAADIHVGDLVIATTPVTITFADGTQAIAAVGSQLRMLPDQAVELVSGELVANTSEQTDKFTVQSIGATFVVSDAIFRVKVDDAGNVSQFTDAGRVIAMTPNQSLEVMAGEQANVLKDGLPVKALQPPVVAGQKTEAGAVEFTARTLMSSTVVLIDSQTGAELARFQADENGIVNAAIVPPSGIPAENIQFRADAPDGRKSTVSAVVNAGNNITAASTETTLPPLPPASVGTLPVLSLPALAPAQATSRNGAVVRFNASATDVTESNLPIRCNFGSGTTFPIGLTEVTCTATNSQGRTATGSFKVSVVDTLPPIIRLPQMRIQSAATSPSGASVSFSVSAADTVDGSVAVNCNARPGQTFPIGTTSVQCTAIDSFGNATQGAFDVVVRDDAAPVMRLPDGLSLPASSRSGAEVSFEASAVDVVDGAVPVNCTPAPGAAFPIGTTTVNCTVTDKAGNTSRGSFEVSVSDNTAPTMEVPAPISTQATSASGAQVTFNVTANDLVDGNLSVSCTPRAGSVFPIGQTAVTCRVSDSAGNSTSRTFNVTVADTTAPRLALPATLSISATGPNGASVSYTAAATDTVDGTLAPSCSPRSGSLFPLGSNTVTCRVTDARGNQSTGTFNVVVRDTNAPVLALPGVITAEAETSAGVTVNFNATARDAIDGTIPPACTPVAGATFPLGSTTVRCTATDKAGNAETDSFTVNVLDTRAPVLRLSDDVIAKATSRAGATVSFTVSAADTVDGSLTPVCTPRTGGVFAIGDTSVTCRATDGAGNVSTGTFKVTVRHDTPPVLSMPVDQTTEATGPSGAVVSFTVTANSSVEGPIAPVCLPAAGSTFPLGATVVNCRATDEFGNTATGRFTVSVVDTTAPAIIMPSVPATEANNGRRGAVVQFNPTVTDRVDNAVSVVCTPRSGSTFDIGTTQVSCRATDSSGNVSTGALNVVVQDTTAPDIATLGTQTADATSSEGAVVNFNVTANDAADGALTVNCSPRSGSTFPLGTTSVTCTASDQAGLSKTASFNVVVADRGLPVVSVPANMNVPTTNPGGAPVTFNVSASDNVDGALTPSCSSASGATFPVGTTTVTCSVTDKAGNSGSGTFQVTVVYVDNVKPDVAVPGTITVQATSDAGAVVNYAASATDNVDGALIPTCDPTSGSLFPVGNTTVTCSVTDRAGNAGSNTFQVVVLPPAAPTPTETPVATATPVVTNTPAVASLTPGTQQTAGVIEATAGLSGTTTLTQTVGLPPTP